MTKKDDDDADEEEEKRQQTLAEWWNDDYWKLRRNITCSTAVIKTTARNRVLQIELQINSFFSFSSSNIMSIITSK